MAYKVQIFYPESGFYHNTNDKSENLEELKALVASTVFDGFKYRIVDAVGDVVPMDYSVRERRASSGIHDIAGMLGVPVKEPFR